MLADNYPCRTHHSRQQDEAAKPPHGVEIEKEAECLKSSDEQPATCHMDADLPLQVDERAAHHAHQRCHDDAAQIARKVHPLHQDEAGDVAHYRQDVGQETPLPFAQLAHIPSVYPFIKVDEKERRQHRERKDHAQDEQLVAEGHDVQVGAEEQEQESDERHHERAEDV